ncbi:hypothetical protein [Frigoribacterium sp. MCBA15_019]|uniref:hypothetical protein n=1 Tax=Frigoribacterium sp. MCBA15_019 TaxID=1898745 RepID=UPI0008DC9A20|nr:hypothetical protein [Frigoribacterium sp. MCBA15_019]OII27613.1 hypothetical protein BIV04_03560 [Frigoribacterium sp. MCBA15_019]
MSDAPNGRPDGPHGRPDRPGLDGERAEAIRGLLTETVEREPERARSARRRRVVLLSVAGVAAVALAVGGVALAGGGPLPSGNGEAAPTSLPSDRPEDDPGTSPGVVEPAGTPSATPVPPPAPVVDDPTAPSTWIVSTDRIGPLVLGGPLEEQAARLTTFDRHPDDGYGCPASFFSDGRGLTLALSRASSPDSTEIATVSADLTFDDPAALASATPRTASGIGLGDDEARLLAAYPDAELTLDHDANYGTQYAVAGDDGQYLVFVVGTSGRITGMSVGTTRIAPPEYCG